MSASDEVEAPRDPAPPAEARFTSASSRHRRHVLELVALVLTVVASPLLLRPVNRVLGPRTRTPPYAPALESSRERLAFDPQPLNDLRYLDPHYVFIGDSMLGSRLDYLYLTTLIEDPPIALLAYPASASAHWFLTLKNYVIASGVHPKWTFVYFRDTNLTEPLFRIDDRRALDQMALLDEPILNAVVAARRQGPWYRLHGLLERTFEIDRARAWSQRAVVEWPIRLLAPPDQRARLMGRINGDIFGLEHLRPMTAADIAEAGSSETDFEANVERSFLPHMLRLASVAQIKLCFVRVQRRPEGGRPPAQSPALERYTAALRRYVEARGAVFHDETGDPAMTLDMYADGDHLAREARVRYTDHFRERMERLFR
jgi:hypothetical protein